VYRLAAILVQRNNIHIYDIQGTLDPRNVKEIVRGTQQSSVSGQEEAEVEDLKNAEVTNFEVSVKPPRRSSGGRVRQQDA
jgi:hypothetical protein